MTHVAAGAYTQVVANARRLRDDALLLHEHHRYASSLALGILSAEELGKAMLISWAHSGDEAPRLLSHVHKQAAFGAVLSGIFVVETILNWCREHGYILVKQEHISSIHPLSDPPALVDDLAKAMSKSEQVHVIDTYIFGTLERIKHLSLYIDFDSRAPITFDVSETDSLRQLEELTRALDGLQNPNSEPISVVAKANYQQALIRLKQRKSQ